MRRMNSIIAGLVLVIFLGCGGGSEAGSRGDAGGGSGGTGGGSAGPADLCPAICEREVRCEEFSSTSECLSRCQADNGRYMALLDPAFVSKAAKCYPGLGCEDSADSCVSAAAASVAPKGNKDSLYLSCRMRLPECHAEDTLLVVCGYATVFNQQGRSSLEACLAKTCAEVGSCVAALIGSL